MAELIAFHYKPGDTYLHRMDIRCKLLILFLLNALLLNTTPAYLGCMSAILLAALFWQRVPVKAALYQSRIFLLLLFFVFISRSLAIPGEPLIVTGYFTMTYQGVISGVIYCWRLLLVLLAGILFIITSRSTEIKAGIQWFLKPVPFIPEKRIAVMISLMVRFLPLVLEQAGEISDAQKTRAAEKIRNPVRKLSLFSIPLLRRVFQTADKLVLAMEARSYTESRTDPELKFSVPDLVITFIIICFTTVVFLQQTLR